MNILLCYTNNVYIIHNYRLKQKSKWNNYVKNI